MNEIVINVWVLLSILMDLGLVLAGMHSWSSVNYCGGNALTGERVAYLFFSYFIVRYLSVRIFSCLCYMSSCDRLLRTGCRPQEFFNIFSNKFFIWGWGFCQKILVKKGMEVLHFLYELKNNPWKDFINSAVVPDFECGSNINISLYLSSYIYT